MRRLFPGPPVDIDVANLYRALDRRTPGDRPWVELCMVTSIDGTTAVAGRSGGLGNGTDSAVLSTLRNCADVIVVGSTTAHRERYGPPRKQGQRVGVVTSTGDIDLELPLFQSGSGFLITTVDAPSHGLDAIRAGTTKVDLRNALRALDADVIHVEGGPTLNAALLTEGLVDEVNLTISPKLVGGEGQRLARPVQVESLRNMELAHVCHDDGFVFLRYVRTDCS